MSLVSDYNEAMIRSDMECCIRIEKEHGLYGYPPEIVSVGLNAADNGNCPYLAIDDYINQSRE